MNVELIDDPDTLRALTPEWDALWRSHGRFPFQSPHWLLPWWDAFGTGALRTAVARQDGRLAGILPAYVLDDGAGPKLLPVGAGTTDALDALGDGAEAMLHALLARAAAEHVTRFDMIDVPPGSALRQATAPPGWTVTWSAGAACPVLTLPGIPARAARKLRMNRNRAARAGGMSIVTADAASLPATLDALIALHRARWAAGNEPGVLADPAVLRFHRLATPALLHAGLLRLTALHLGDTVAASIMSLLAPGRICFYLTGYDPAHRFVSPGSLLLGAMLDQAAAEGRTEAHFLRGREGYKYDWGASDRMNADGAFVMAAAPRSGSRPHP